jgi:hypothetical protein
MAPVPVVLCHKVRLEAAVRYVQIRYPLTPIEVLHLTSSIDPDSVHLGIRRRDFGHGGSMPPGLARSAVPRWFSLAVPGDRSKGQPGHRRSVQMANRVVNGTRLATVGPCSHFSGLTAHPEPDSVAPHRQRAPADQTCSTSRPAGLGRPVIAGQSMGLSAISGRPCQARAARVNFRRSRTKQSNSGVNRCPRHLSCLRRSRGHPGLLGGVGRRPIRHFRVLGPEPLPD